MSAAGGAGQRCPELIECSARPLVLAGGGVVAARAHEQLVAFTLAADIPYVTTLQGLECGGGRGWLGMPGVYGTRVGNWALHQADCILAVGARFDDRLTGRLDGFAPRARVIHVDADASELGKLVTPEIAICADERATLEALAAESARRRTDPRGGRPSRSGSPWIRCRPPRPTGARPRGRVGRDARPGRRDHDRCRAASDVGRTRLSMGGGRRWITSGGAGTMGFGLPAALGAQAASPPSGRVRHR